MKAILCTAFTGHQDLQVGEVDPPPLGADEVRIAVHAATVTFMDNLLVSGQYQMKPELPFVVGTDAAGEVLEVGGDVTRVKPGDRVAAACWFGALAEEMVTKDYKAIHLPKGVDYELGTIILHNYITGLYSLRDRCQMASGETLVVHGAAGAVGLAAVDLGRHMGARVIGTVGSDEKAQFLLDYGADAAINYNTESIRDRVKELTDGRGADVFYDTVGGDAFDQSVRCIAWGGRILIVGFTSGRIPELAMNLPLLKNFSVVGVFAGAWMERSPEGYIRMADTIMEWVTAGHLKPHIHAEMPLEDAAKAMGMLERREVIGRIVLKVR